MLTRTLYRHPRQLDVYMYVAHVTPLGDVLLLDVIWILKRNGSQIGPLDRVKLKRSKISEWTPMQESS